MGSSYDSVHLFVPFFSQVRRPFYSEQKTEAFVIYESEIYNMKGHAFEGKILFVGEKQLSDLLRPY